MKIEEGQIIDLILEAGNHPKLMKTLEPNIIRPMKLESWMVRRTLVARAVVKEAIDKKAKEGEWLI